MIIRQLIDKLIIHNKLGYYKISDSVMLHGGMHGKEILIRLRSNLRGLPFDESIFLSDTVVIENIINDVCPPLREMSSRYDRKYGNSEADLLRDNL